MLLKSSLTGFNLRWLQPTHRVFLGVFCNYALMSTAVAAIGLGVEAAGVASKANGLMWAILLAFLLYPSLLIWCFAERHAWRIWAVFSVITAASYFTVEALGGDTSFGFA